MNIYVLGYQVFLTSLVKQEVDGLPRGLKSAFSLHQPSSTTSYHTLPVTSLLRAVVDELCTVGKQGEFVVLIIIIPTHFGISAVI